MVATTFAARYLPLLGQRKRIVRPTALRNWIWWNMLFGAMLTVFFFARLWRRSGVLTDVEFVELRYGGKPAAWLRGLKALYFGLLLNVIILA